MTGSRTMSVPLRLVAGALAGLALAVHSAPAAAERPRIHTNERYIEDVTRRTALPLDDPKAMLAFVLDGIPDRAKVYPTENYYYFYFYHQGTRHGGNIRLDVADRDAGKLHFAYFVEPVEWQADEAVRYRVFGKEDGVLVERLAPLRYRVTLGARSVVFELNDLAAAAPPPAALGPDDQYLGPVFDESGIRFFLLFNRALKLFHYVLDETVPVADALVPSRLSERILVGRRTGFAFYDEHRLSRKILIGVFETNSRVNNYLDGPFDQLPDNFITGDTLRQAIVAARPDLKDKIDRLGGSPDGASRYLIDPYIYYRDEEELLAFHRCATDPKLPPALYHACFVVHERGDDEDADDGAPR